MYKLLTEEKSYLELLKEQVKGTTKQPKILEEQGVKIPVEHPGVLEVPEGKSVDSLGEDHFKALIKKKGWSEISKALTNLHTWNEKENPKLAKWADNMQEKLGKWVDSERASKNDENLYEQQVKIPVKHPGVLEVPEGKNVEDLPLSHFVALAKKKGFPEISKALINLKVWNEKRNPKLAKWADDMQEKLAAEQKE